MSVQNQITRIVNAKAAIKAAIEGKGVTVPSSTKLDGMAEKITAIPTKQSVTWHQCPQLVRDYLDNVTYNPNDYTTSQIANYAPSTAVASNTKPIAEIVTGDAHRNEVPNVATPFSSTNKAGTVKPLDRLRWINTQAVDNVRDIGGWDCDGGSVKYGRIFRGGQLRTATAITATQEDIELFRNALGIKSEINYQVQSEGGGSNPTPLGDDIIYYPLPMSYKVVSMNYDSIVDMEGSLYTTFATALKHLIYNGRYNITTYFNCTHGADRTGVTAWFLEHLLGVSDSDCDKDYELTSFDPVAAFRKRNDGRYRALINYMKTCSNGSMRDCVVAWCVKNGIPIADINAFRNAMIDGTPTALTANINNATKSITANTPSISVNAGETKQISVKILPYWSTSAVSWSTSDATKATVSGNGRTATITGVDGGNVTVTATSNGVSATFAVEVTAQPSYTNQIPISTDASGNVYNGFGYKNGVYLSSTDGITEEPNASTFATGFIPAKNGDVLRCTFNGVVTGGAKVRIVSYNSAKTKLSHKVLTTAGAWNSVESGKGTLNLTGSNFPSETTYIRICLPGTGAASVVTINEEIE